MEFKRGRDTREAFDIGLSKKIPSLMKNSGFDSNDYYDVCLWALEKNKLYIFKFILSLNGKPWKNTKVDASELGNSFLWDIIIEKRPAFLRELFKIPNIIHPICMTMEKEFIHVGDDYSRLGKTIYTPLGFYRNKSLELGDSISANLISKYYKKNI